MSVNVKWRPLSDNGVSFERGTSSEFDALKRACGDVLGVDDVKILRAMALATRSEFYNEVADTIEKVGAIRIWGEY